MSKIVFFILFILTAYSYTIVRVDQEHFNKPSEHQEFEVLDSINLPQDMEMIDLNGRLLQTQNIPDRQLIIEENTFDAIHYFQLK